MLCIQFGLNMNYIFTLSNKKVGKWIGATRIDDGTERHLEVIGQPDIYLGIYTTFIIRLVFICIRI